MFGLQDIVYGFKSTRIVNIGDLFSDVNSVKEAALQSAQNAVGAQLSAKPFKSDTQRSQPTTAKDSTSGVVLFKGAFAEGNNPCCKLVLSQLCFALATLGNAFAQAVTSLFYMRSQKSRRAVSTGAMHTAAMWHYTSTLLSCRAFARL